MAFDPKRYDHGRERELREEAGDPTIILPGQGMPYTMAHKLAHAMKNAPESRFELPPLTYVDLSGMLYLADGSKILLGSEE